MKRNTLFLNLVLAWIFVGLGSALAEKPVNDSERVTLNGNVHPAVTAASVGSAVDDSTPMEHMVLLRSRRRHGGRDELVRKPWI